MKLFLSVTSTTANFDRSLTLNEEGATLGRLEDNTLVLPDAKKYISGHHAVIKYRAPDYFITDTSTNGVLINQSTIPLGNGNSIKLNDGDQLHINDYVITVKMIEDYRQSVARETGSVTATEAEKAFDFNEDPFAQLTADPIKEMIDKNELLPAGWKENQETPKDPFDISDLHSHASNSKEAEKAEVKDFDHVPAFKEAFQPFREQTVEQQPIAPSSASHIDIIAEDWYLDKKSKSADDIQSTNSFSSIRDVPLKNERDQPCSPPPPEAANLSTPIGFQDELIQNFLRGAGLENSHCAEVLTPESFYVIGKILRESVQGSMDVLLGRAKIKNEMHLDITMIRAKQNNPIKFSVSSEEALLKLLTPQNKAYLQPEDAIKEAFDDIRAHQYSVMAGMRTALLAVLKRFDPTKLQQRLQELNPISAGIPIHRQAKLWSLFEHLYKDIEREAEDNFYHLFGQAFAETYEQQMQNLKKSKQEKPFE